MSYTAKSGNLLPAGATNVSAIVQFMDAGNGTVGLGSVTITSWPAVWLHVPGLASGSITLSNLASATADFSAGGVFFLGNNEFRLDYTVNGAAVAHTIAGKNATYELNLLRLFQVGDSANAMIGVNGVQLGGAASTLGLSGSTLTLNGTALAIIDPAGVTTLLTRLTSGRAGYLDNLNTGGLVASAANLLNLTNNTFVASDVPQNLERPDSGSETVPITFIFCDDTGAAKDLDSGNPTLALTNNAGTDLSARLAGSGATWTHVATGEYKILYTNTSTDAIATLHWKVTGTINGVVRKAIFPTQIVDVTAVDFTSSDRTDLQTILARADVTTSSRMATYAQPTGFLAATFPGGTIASTTNITAGVITTVTNLTNLPAITAGWLTASGIAANALNGKGDWNTTTPPTAAAIATATAAQVTADHGDGSYVNVGGGDGAFAVNHDSGGTDALRYEHNSSGIAGATIRAYVAEDYDASVFEPEGRATTGSDGRWIAPIMLDAGDYVLTFDAAGYDLLVQRITVDDAGEVTLG